MDSSLRSLERDREDLRRSIVLSAEMSQAAPALGWLSRLPEAGEIRRLARAEAEAIEAIDDLRAKIDERRADLVVLRARALDEALRDWSPDEIRAARTGS